MISHFYLNAGHKISQEKGAFPVPEREGHSYHGTGSGHPNGSTQTNLLK